MDRRNVVIAALVLAGLVLIGYGVYTGDEGLQWLAVEEVPSEDAPDGMATIEYDYLTPETQDVFREALAAESEIQFDSRPPDGQYVRYRGSVYRATVTYAAANQATMFFSILGGVGLLVLAALVQFSAKIRAIAGK